MCSLVVAKDKVHLLESPTVCLRNHTQTSAIKQNTAKKT
jgi:hypothetical protein